MMRSPVRPAAAAPPVADEAPNTREAGSVECPAPTPAPGLDVPAPPGPSGGNGQASAPVTWTVPAPDAADALALALTHAQEKSRFGLNEPKKI